MNKKFRRLGSMALAGAMAMSMAVPAFAANETTITGTYTPIELRVVVPATGGAIINPYGLPFQLGESTISGQQITTSAPLVIQNKSSVALAVTANLQGTPSSGVTLEASTASTNYDTETTKKLHVVFEAFETTLDTNNVTDNDTLRPMFAALDSADAVLTGDVTTTAGDATGTLVLREANDGEVQSGGAAIYRLSGEVAKKAAWAADDNFEAKVAFTFEPGEYTKSAGTIASQRNMGMSGGADNTSTMTLTPDLPSGVTATSTTWTSSDETVIKVDTATATTATTAKYKAIGAGTADVIVTIAGSDGLTYKATLSITVAA